MKTFQDLLDYFSDRPEIQEQIKKNTSVDDIPYVDREAISSVLGACFVWGETQQGFEYWKGFMLELYRAEL